MGRNKDYDRQEVLKKAVGVFWQNGYKASSITEVVNATGLNTASMYKEFGDKDGLFEEALEHYRQHNMSPRFQNLIDNPNFNGVQGFVEDVINSATSENYRGCLMMNHLAQKHSISPQAAQKVGDFCAAMEGLLKVAIGNAQTTGEISADKDPAILASFIMCCVHGLVLYGRHPNKKSDIHGIRSVIFQALKG